MHHHHYNLSDLENMMPWERYVYLDLLSGYQKKREEEYRDQAAANKRRR
jgi:hypothetical protein